LRPEERAMVRSVSITLSRAPSTISRELKKNCQDGQIYEAAATGSDQEGAEKHSTSRATQVQQFVTQAYDLTGMAYRKM